LLLLAVKSRNLPQVLCLSVGRKIIFVGQQCLCSFIEARNLIFETFHMLWSVFYLPALLLSFSMGTIPAWILNYFSSLSLGSTRIILLTILFLTLSLYFSTLLLVSWLVSVLPLITCCLTDSFSLDTFPGTFCFIQPLLRDQSQDFLSSSELSSILINTNYELMMVSPLRWRGDIHDISYDWPFCSFLGIVIFLIPKRPLVTKES
jgi:hypothetical protein